MGPGYRDMRALNVTVPVPSFAELRTSWDCDEYKRWALRTRLRQTGIIQPQTRFVRERRVRSRGLGGASWGAQSIVNAERQRYARNWKRTRRYEAVVLPNPFVKAMTREMQGFIVDLRRLHDRQLLRDGRDPVRRLSFWTRMRARFARTAS